MLIKTAVCDEVVLCDMCHTCHDANAPCAGHGNPAPCRCEKEDRNDDESINKNATDVPLLAQKE